MGSTIQIPPALRAERLASAVNAARRSLRRAALAVETAVIDPAGNVQDRIEDVVRAGTALELAEAEYAAVTA